MKEGQIELKQMHTQQHTYSDTYKLLRLLPTPTTYKYVDLLTPFHMHTSIYIDCLELRHKNN